MAGAAPAAGRHLLVPRGVRGGDGRIRARAPGLSRRVCGRPALRPQRGLQVRLRLLRCRHGVCAPGQRGSGRQACAG